MEKSQSEKYYGYFVYRWKHFKNFVFGAKYINIVQQMPDTTIDLIK